VRYMSTICRPPRRCSQRGSLVPILRHPPVHRLTKGGVVFGAAAHAHDVSRGVFGSYRTRGTGVGSGVLSGTARVPGSNLCTTVWF
jgi:hypothetical protein